MVFFLILIGYTLGNIVKIKEKFKGPILTELSKAPMYTKLDIYGQFNSSITIKWSPSELDGYVVILDSSEAEKLLNYSVSINITYCEPIKASLLYIKSLSSGNLQFNVTKTDTYHICLLLCTDTKFTFEGEIKNLNPYGYVQADLLPLIPFYFFATVFYLLLLLTWLCRLCIYYRYSIQIQRFWIPCILILCILENFFDLSSWLSLNSTGFKNITTQMSAVIVKSFKDALGRTLLIAASKGFGIIQSTHSGSNSILYILGILYFIFDLIYQISFKLDHNPEMLLLIGLSIPLIILNTTIFYLIFSWFSKTFFRLKFYKQEYKLKLMKQFALVLGIGGLISLIWGGLEILARHFWKRNIWWVNSMYFAVWDLIFFFVIISLLVIWRVNINSKLLADTQELRDEDHEISHEDEGKFGIELSKVSRKN